MQGKAEYQGMSTSLLSTTALITPRIQMFAFLLAGASIASLHIVFFTYLEGKSVTPSVFLRNQSVVSAISNTFAYLVKTCFAGAVGVAFVQFFWLKLRERGGTIGEIDAMLDVKDHPLSLSSLSVLRNGFWLLMVGGLGSAFALVSVLVPGALSVVTASFHDIQPCLSSIVTVPNASKQITDVWAWIETRVAEQGSYFSPSDPCNGAACRYSVEFNAPAIRCDNITSSYDLSAFKTNLTAVEFYDGPVGLADLLPDLPNGTTYIGPLPNVSSYIGRPHLLYHANWTNLIPYPIIPPDTPETIQQNYSIQVAWYNISSKISEALQCEAYLAAYSATITHNGNGTAPLVDVHETSYVADFRTSIDTTYQSGMLLIATLALELLQTDLYMDMYGSLLQVPLPTNSTPFDGYSEFAAESPLLHSSFFVPRDNIWQFATKMSIGIPSLMQNISISLLSDDVWAYTGSNIAWKVLVNGTAAPTATCLYSATVYRFSRLRLIVTYGLALLFAAACSILVGERAIRSNGGVQERVGFARLLASLVNEKLCEARQRMELSMDTALLADKDAEGMLRPVYQDSVSF